MDGSTLVPAVEVEAAPARCDVPGVVRTLACVVTYEPDRAHLTDLLLDLQTLPGLEIVLIDNSEGPTGCSEVSAVADAFNARAICNSSNRGVGEAHNQAIDVARIRGCQRLLLLDQDSLLTGAAVQQLHDSLDALLAAGVKVAAVGPRFVDPRTDEHGPFVRLGRGLRMRHVDFSESDRHVPCDLLISSGCLMPVSVFDTVGRLDGGLFIEYVDVEWCARARSHGYKLFGIPSAQMLHTIGESSVRRFGRRWPLHSPYRQYYLVRNALLFARKRYLPLRWRLHLVTRAIAQFVLYAGFCTPRWQRARWMALGAWHGLLGRDGRLGGPDGLGWRAAAHPERHTPRAPAELGAGVSQG